MEGCNWVGLKFHLSINRHGRVSLWDSIGDAVDGCEAGEVVLDLVITDDQARLIREAQEKAA